MANGSPGAWSGTRVPLAAPHLSERRESIDVACYPSNPLTKEPVRYVADFRETVSASEFERAIDAFVSVVIERLNTLDHRETYLHRLWAEVLEERVNPAVSSARRLEAKLGYDPDEAPEWLVQHMLSVSEFAGTGAADEIAPVCAGADPESVLASIESFAAGAGAKAQIDLRRMPKLSRARRSEDRPWTIGRELAGALRNVYGLGSGPISDEELAGLFGLPAWQVESNHPIGSRPPLGLAVREKSDGPVRLLFRKRNRPGIRFEAARFLCDYILTPATEHWLPATDSSTARQKTQRAFAAEFLCPIHALDDFLQNDHSEEAIGDAAEHFGISDLAVQSHLSNHHRI